MNYCIQVRLLSLLVAVTLCCVPVWALAGTEGLRAHLGAARMPFIENAGQWREGTKFFAPVFAGAFFVTDGGTMSYLLEGADEGGRQAAVMIEETFVGAAGLEISGAGRMAAAANYLIGRDPARWRVGAGMYEEVSFGQVYESIIFDLSAHGATVEKRFTIRPGGNPGDIRLKVRAPGSLSLSETGELVVATNAGDVTFSRPVAYQNIDGSRRLVDVAYVVDGDEYGFEVGGFSAEHDLVIDPLLAGTYFGGSEGDGLGELPMVKDADGNIYVADRTMSWDLPTTPTAFDTSFSTARSDIFISKFDGDLCTLIASTFLGGTGYEGAWPGADLVLGDDGTVWVAAMTKAGDFPVTPDAYDTTYNGLGDFFIAHLTADLEHLLAATYLGGSNKEQGPHLAVGDGGYVFLVGITKSPDYPSVYGCIDTTYAGGDADVVVTRLDTALTEVSASTYLGGAGYDAPEAILLDDEGYPFIGGWTMSPVWPTTPGAYSETYAGGSYDGFITRLSPDLTQVSASTFLGGSYWDFVYDMIMEDGSAVYVTGHTASDYDFPTTPGVYDSTYGGVGIQGTDDDAYVSKLSADLGHLLASTYLGGTGWEQGLALTLDAEGHVYVAGTTNSDDFPTGPDEYDGSYGGTTNFYAGDVFVARLDTALVSLTASTYMGSGGIDLVGSIVWGGDGLYICMGTNSDDLETSPGAYDDSFNGGESMGADLNWGGDVYIAKLDPLLSDATGSVEYPEGPFDAVMLSSWPNPCATSAVVRFRLEEPSPVRVVLYDVTGQAVGVLMDDMAGAGENEVYWDGRDDRGELVTPGVYFLVLERDGGYVSRKVVSIR